MKQYRFGFQFSALALFLAIMLPNIVWSFFPAPNDILRNKSATQILDAFATVFQVIMIAMLCLIKNKNAFGLKIAPVLLLSAVSALSYGCCWIMYYCGIVHSAVLIGLSLLPCLSFLFYGLDRKNYVALIPIAIFTVLHLISTIINFL